VPRAPAGIVGEGHHARDVENRGQAVGRELVARVGDGHTCARARRPRRDGGGSLICAWTSTRFVIRRLVAHDASAPRRCAQCLAPSALATSTSVSPSNSDARRAASARRTASGVSAATAR
jgi:hypothetical protein